MPRSLAVSDSIRSSPLSSQTRFCYLQVIRVSGWLRHGLAKDNGHLTQVGVVSYTAAGRDVFTRVSFGRHLVLQRLCPSLMLLNMRGLNKSGPSLGVLTIWAPEFWKLPHLVAKRFACNVTILAAGSNCAWSAASEDHLSRLDQ